MYVCREHEARAPALSATSLLQDPRDSLMANITYKYITRVMYDGYVRWILSRP